ncbi:MAG TPA: hypothetical protein VLX29_11585 [Nitrospirota bacterium]|nr:hypothetical protein [Nitrospirota bacterium]
MKKIVLMAVVIHCLFAIVFVSYSMAVIYKYVDKDGNLCFADDLQVIPEQYRASALIVQGESKDEPAKARIPTAADSVREQSISTAQDIPQKHAALSFSYRLMISGCIIIGTILAIYILRNQAALKNNKKLTSIICNALIVITSLYLVIAHVKDAITVVGLAGNSLDNVLQQSAEKGRKAAQAMKKIDALFENAQKTEEGDN